MRSRLGRSNASDDFLKLRHAYTTTPISGSGVIALRRADFL
jgi:hypothetical protein